MIAPQQTRLKLDGVSAKDMHWKNLVAAYDNISIWSKEQSIQKFYYEEATEQLIRMKCEGMKEDGLKKAARELETCSVSPGAAIFVTEENKHDSKFVTTVIVSRLKRGRRAEDRGSRELMIATVEVKRAINATAVVLTALVTAAGVGLIAASGGSALAFAGLGVGVAFKLTADHQASKVDTSEVKAAGVIKNYFKIEEIDDEWFVVLNDSSSSGRVEELP